MPIYEYQCQHCGHHIEKLQKVSDTPIKHCDVCGHDTMSKLVSSPSFQLKGEGWYVTDFRDKDKKTKPDSEKPVAEPATDSSTKTEGTKEEGKKVQSTKTDKSGTMPEKAKSDKKKPPSTKE